MILHRSCAHSRLLLYDKYLPSGLVEKDSYGRIQRQRRFLAHRGVLLVLPQGRETQTTPGNHLTILKNEGLISGWKDADITAGAEWDDEIKKHLNAAKIILLLISEDFLASKYCYDIEMKRAMERHERGEARVIPIILHEVDWSRAPFGKLKALPKDGKAVSSWRNRAQAFKNVALGIRNAIEELRSDVAAATTRVSVADDSLPAIWNVPHQRNINFTGREGLLKELITLCWQNG